MFEVVGEPRAQADTSSWPPGALDLQPSATAPRIDIDGFNLALEEGTGVATYTRELHKSIRAMGREVGVLYGRRLRTSEPLLREMDFFDTPRRRRGWIQSALAASASWRSVRATEVKLTGTVIFEDLRDRFPAASLFWNIDNLFSRAATFFNVFGRSLVVKVPRPPAVMHWTYPLPIRVEGAKNIYTLHDMVPLRLPHTTLDNKRRYFKLVKHIARTADHIITVSENSKRDIIDLLGVNENNVSNTYQSYEASRSDETAETGGICAFFGLERQKYFLFFGAVEPKKNVGRLLEAYLSVNTETPLVIVGKSAWMHERELRLLNVADSNAHSRLLSSSSGDTQRGSRVLRIEHLPRHTLKSLIRDCRAVIFPSLYEGFGLPVLEAMAEGAPVITSRTSSLPEIAGDAAMLVDPYNVQELADAIRKIDGDAALRHQLSVCGQARARSMFSPERYTERLQEVYARITGLAFK